MHSKPDLRVLISIEIAGSGSVIVDVIGLGINDMLELLCRSIWGERLVVHDPMFGELSTERIKRRGRLVGRPPMYEWYGVIDFPEALVEEFCVHAPSSGPTEIQRESWAIAGRNRAKLLPQLKAHLFENYQTHREILIEYCRNEYGDADLGRFKRWSEIDSSDDMLNDRPCYIKIHGDGEIEVYLSTEWDEEHNLRIFIKDGQIVNWSED